MPAFRSQQRMQPKSQSYMLKAFHMRLSYLKVSWSIGHANHNVAYFFPLPNVGFRMWHHIKMAMRINHRTPNKCFTSSEASSLIHCLISSRVLITTFAYSSNLFNGSGPLTSSPRSIS